MEEYEEKAEEQEREASQAKGDLRDANQKIDELEGTNYNLQVRIKKLEEECKSKKGAANSDEVSPEVEKKLKHSEDLLTEKEKLLSQKMEDNFNLKDMLDKTRSEMAKLKQRNETLQDRLDNKELQCSQLTEDMKSLEKRMKQFNLSNMNSEDAQKRANQAKQ